MLLLCLTSTKPVSLSWKCLINSQFNSSHRNSSAEKTRQIGGLSYPLKKTLFMSQECRYDIKHCANVMDLIIGMPCMIDHSTDKRKQ